ncbi:uncharacterized protein LOC132605906 [Lycium barbarum]|uniref:uncharacterized protein LOC132605906 n=1 Tax=Lycium barbarum TaxID=112863 RepID=UPI00293F6405|nr:uncharacterized protein LOC132605906 [Lycium barbarum]XP_060175163.1 uncharacterized protein LOC132605906 [Lycium barbarum]
MSTEWSENIYAKEALGKEVARYIVGPYFWNECVQALKVSNPLVTVLCLVDGEKQPPMGYIYEAMDKAKESIEKAFEKDKRKYGKVFEIIDKKWTDQLNQPLHTTAHILNPGLSYIKNKKKALDSKVWVGYHACIARMVPDDVLQDQIGEGLGKYMAADGILGLPQAIRARPKLSLLNWWMQFGHGVPNLKEFAIRVQSLTCSSFGCERHCSVYEQIHTKRRNRLELKKLNDLVFVKYNRTLTHCYKARDTIDPIFLNNIDEANE